MPKNFNINNNFVAKINKLFIDSKTTINIHYVTEFHKITNCPSQNTCNNQTHTTDNN